MGDKLKIEQVFKQAEAVVKTDPLAGDYIEQLEALEAQLPTDQLDNFSHFYETGLQELGRQAIKVAGL